MTLPLPVTPVQARSGGSYEPRGALVIHSETPLGRMQALNTHLDASGPDTYRQQEADNLGAMVRERARLRMPLMLGGDLNATPESAVIGKVTGFGLRDAFAECGQGDGLTYPSDKPVKRIDYLFLDRTLHCTDARVIDTRVSDYRPLLVTVLRKP